MKHLRNFIIGCGVIFALCVLGCGIGGIFSEETSIKSVESTSEVKKEDKKIEYIKVSAKDLINNYEDNELKADEMYKDKHLEITGIVSSIDKVLGQTSVTLGTGKDLEVTQISCMFDKKYEEDVAELKKGSEIIITGKCEGKGWNVDMKDCEIK